MPAAIERTLKGATTARNWNTMLKLDELAKRRLPPLLKGSYPATAL